MITKIFRKCSVTLGLILILSGAAFSQTDKDIKTEDFRKLGQSSFKFLQVSVDARAASMADAMTGQQANSTALFYNPASMAWMEGNISVGLGYTQWIADVNYNSGSAAFKTPLGVFGVSALMVDYGDFYETIVDPDPANEQGYIELGQYQPSAYAFGVGYARALTDRFGVGAHLKYVGQDLGTTAIDYAEGDADRKNYALNTLAVDFGVFYDTGFEGLKLAMSARNFSRELTYVEDNFELPLQFRIGLSMDVMNLMANYNPEIHSLVMSIDTERPRDYYEQIKLGVEYTFLNTFSLRAGYIAPHDEQGINVGLGLTSVAGFDVDYSYTDFGVFDGVSRFAVKYAF